MVKHITIEYSRAAQDYYHIDDKGKKTKLETGKVKLADAISKVKELKLKEKA